MPAVHRAWLHHIHPHTVELRRAIKVEVRSGGKGLHLAVEQSFEVGKCWIALWQVRKARVAGIAAIPFGLAPGTPSAILLREQAAALL